MRLGSLLKTLVSPEAMGDQIVKLQEQGYTAAMRLYPGNDPHFLLAHVWLSRMAAMRVDVSSSAMKNQAFYETIQFACLRPPLNARALGLFMLNKERPDIAQRFTKFEYGFAEVMQPIFQAIQEKSLENLYVTYNPVMGKDESWLSLIRLAQNEA